MSGLQHPSERGPARTSTTQQIGTDMSTTTTPRPSSRRRRRVALTTLGLMLVGVVAWAAVMSGVGVRGQLGRGQFTALWTTASQSTPVAYVGDVNPTTGALTGQVETPTKPTLDASRRSLTVPSVEVFAGQALQVQHNVELGTSNRGGYVSGIEVADPTKLAGWEVRLVNGCLEPVSSLNTPARPVVRVNFRPISDTAGPLDIAAADLQVQVTMVPGANGSTVLVQPPAGATCKAVLTAP